MPKTNNFDLIRLAAALQVAVMHSIVLLAIDTPPSLRALLATIPGVPVFFFISGFLISGSFENNPRLPEYVRNRLLRIYPGLIVCFLVSLISVWLTGYFGRTEIPASTFLAWVAAQLSIGQFFNPQFMRQYGEGVLNGSLWTISVELQFYVLVPLLYRALRLRSLSGFASNIRLLSLIGLFILANQAYWHAGVSQGRTLPYKLVAVSFVPWFYMFLTGVLFQRNYVLVRRLLAGRFIFLMAGFGVLSWIAAVRLGWGSGNSLNPIQFLMLCLLAGSAAFSAPGLSDRLLRRNDVSYGVYIYHAPVINFALATALFTGPGALWAVLAATIILALGSWWLVEKPALSLKRHALYNHKVAGAAS